jgi:uncharacterized protein (TIGR02186 family)
MRGFWVFIYLFCAGLMTSGAAPAGCESPIELTVSPDIIYVDTFFSGADVAITGELPATSDVVVEILGPQTSDLYDVKGRFGPFWMTREKVKLENTPMLYMLLVPQGRDWKHTADELGMGVESLKRQVSIGPSQLAPNRILEMFLRMKTSEGLYREMSSALSYADGPGSRRRFAAECHLPSSTTPGVYTVKATLVDSGGRGSSIAREVSIREAGFVWMINDMAAKRPLVYGILAVVVALLAGAFTGVLFKSRGGH